MLRAALFAIIFTSLLIVGSSSSVWAAQLDARINPESSSSKIDINYQKTVFIEYPDGGEIADELRTKSWTIEVSGDSSNPDVQGLIEKLNQNK